MRLKSSKPKNKPFSQYFIFQAHQLRFVYAKTHLNNNQRLEKKHKKQTKQKNSDKKYKIKLYFLHFFFTFLCKNKQNKGHLFYKPNRKNIEKNEQIQHRSTISLEYHYCIFHTVYCKSRI